MSSTQLREKVQQMCLATDGDCNESSFWPAINDGFPNYERFWIELVVPTTTRIETTSTRHDRRAGIAEDLWQIMYVNYSLFLNLVGAFQHLAAPVLLSASNFYTHLASVCDLAEDFLLRVEMCASECRGDPARFESMTQEQFRETSDQIYAKEYCKKFPHSHGKGKPMLLHFDPLNKFKPRGAAWKSYKSFSGPIREYRNKVVHDVQIGTIVWGRINLMPKPSEIKKYTSISAVNAAAADPKCISSDFVVREEQMWSDFRSLKQHVNSLWEEPLNRLSDLLYKDRNQLLMEKYNLLLDSVFRAVVKGARFTDSGYLPTDQET